MPVRILITGGAGFIGSHLATASLAEEHEVVVVDRLSDYYSPAAKRRNLEAISSGLPQLAGTRTRLDPACEARLKAIWAGASVCPRHPRA
jgi:nucleoside-diphosphate-sugar epimerase